MALGEDCARDTGGYLRDGARRATAGDRRHFHPRPRPVQLEVEGETSRDRQNGGPTAEETGVTTTFTYGATDPLDVFVTVPFFGSPKIGPVKV
ncbi:MAG TPA: hypothetical protein VLA73_00835 [Burkholderiales bacterium]|nr:hypothetical protein [Burkholderiales bacterium]